MKYIEKKFKCFTSKVFFKVFMSICCVLMSFTYLELVLEFESVDQPTLLISSSYSFSNWGLGSMIKHVLMKKYQSTRTQHLGLFHSYNSNTANRIEWNIQLENKKKISAQRGYRCFRRLYLCSCWNPELFDLRAYIGACGLVAIYSI